VADAMIEAGFEATKGGIQGGALLALQRSSFG
jgi:hypothetical protein